MGILNLKRKQTRIFTDRELANVRNGSLTYYMACELKREGAPIQFNIVNVDLKSEDIEINGYLRDRIRMDGSHEFVFEVEDE